MTSIVFGFLGTTYALWLDLPRDDIRWMAFLWAYLGVGIGLSIYCVDLIEGLY